MIRIRPLRVVLLVLSCALLSAGAVSLARAQTDQTEQETGAVSGKIKHLDLSAKMFTIHEATGADWTFSVNKDTTFRSGDKLIKFDSLKEGWSIVVNYDANVGLQPTGNVALEVQVTDTP
jgi:hypothetical protein